MQATKTEIATVPAFELVELLEIQLKAAVRTAQLLGDAMEQDDQQAFDAFCAEVVFPLMSVCENLEWMNSGDEEEVAE